MRFWNVFVCPWGRSLVRSLYWLGPFPGPFSIKISKKWHTKRHPKINAEKVSTNYAKRLQNETKINAKIYDFSYFFEKGENAPDSLFSIMKRGSGISKTSKNQRKIDAKSMLEKVMQKGRKMMPKWSQNGRQNWSKIEKMWKRRGKITCSKKVKSDVQQPGRIWTATVGPGPTAGILGGPF